MLVKTYAAAVQGLSATIVVIEVDCTRGIQFFLVGLPDVAVRESHERIISAMRTNGYQFPRNRIVINMAPADIRKEGSSYDLSLAIGIMAGAKAIDTARLSEFVIMGELSLDGSLQPIKGALSIALQAKEEGFKGLILPRQNAPEAAVVEGINVYGMENIKEVVEFIDGKREVEPVVFNVADEFYALRELFEDDYSAVRGQENVKRALEVAAAGGHNLLMIGPPGSGKSMMAKRLPSILPPLTIQESLETTKIYSVAGKTDKGTSLMVKRPFRSPHHTISNVAMVGGGSVPQPGEISLAHNGVLFLDELPEFNRNVLEVMRQPLEDRCITISRARCAVDYPAGFMLVSSMNPCPCGYYNHPERQCICPAGAAKKYINRISGPLLDRIDIQIETTPVEFETISERTPSEASEMIRKRVIAARDIQRERFKDFPGIYCNAQMTTELLYNYVAPDAAGMAQLKKAMEYLSLSARAYDRILKVSRTIADLEGSANVEACHLAEAINYRSLDRENWGA
ncbi:MAG: YifB family Mg chelatase-like AAA ATPase [Tannerellaceae bacterium]|jgi:magnesium chelatase family protein|nr:YifB family Mg chelatase-like AAA ATPase [Tannerellaceae bacterium]